jgi:hypothetical protein
MISNRIFASLPVIAALIGSAACASNGTSAVSAFLTIAKDSLYDIEIKNSTACPAEVVLAESNGTGKNLITVPARATEVVVVRSSVGGTISALALTPHRTPCDGMLRQPIQFRSIRTTAAE